MLKAADKTIIHFFNMWVCFTACLCGTVACNGLFFHPRMLNE